MNSGVRADKYPEFQTWLRDELYRRSWTQATLAARLGISGQAVGRWMKGEAAPKGARLTALARVLDVELATINRLTAIGQDAERWRIADYLATHLPDNFTVYDARRLILVADALREWDEEMVREGIARRLVDPARGREMQPQS